MKWPRMKSMENWYCPCTQQDETRRYTQFPWYTIFKCPWFQIRKVRGCGNDIGYPSEKSSHYSDVIMSLMASQITKFTIVYSTVYSGAEQRKRQRIEFPSQRASNVANVSFWWCHHVKSREAMFVQSINFIYQIVLKICTELDSDTADLYANFWNDL